MQLQLAWWNTSLSPTKTQRPPATAEKLGCAARIVRTLATAGAQFIALGEVTGADMAQLFELAGLEGYRALAADTPVGRGRFDIGVFYMEAAAHVEHVQAVYDHRNGQYTKAAQRFRLSLAEGQSADVFLSHWPSRLQGDGAERRKLAAMRLRHSLDALRADDPSANVVLAGDYNDEPYDESIAQILGCTRERAVLTKSRSNFYNPYWRHMPEPEAGRGTYFRKGDSHTRWRTFDQMMFSSALALGSSGLRLEGCQVLLSDTPYATMVEAGAHGFDHLPIISTLKQV